MSEHPWSRMPDLRGVVEARDATAVVAAARQRVEDREEVVRAWVGLDERAQDQARALDAADRAPEMPLFGVPVGVKDIIDVAGLPTRCGSIVTPREVAEESASCVSRLEELGAVVLGKTVTTEFAYFRPGPTRNPWQPEHTPGGSSSGSAAAVASGMVPLALGTQTAASLVRPAAFCGVAGLVLSHGTVDLSGIVGLSPSLDSLGLITRTVDDLALAYEALSGRACVNAADGHLLLWSGSGIGQLEPVMEQALARLPGLLADWSAAPGDLDDHVRTLALDHATIMAYEAARERSQELREHRDQLSAPLVELLEQGRRTSDDEYWQASYRRDRSRLDLERALEGTFIIGPAALGAAPAGLGSTGSPIMSRPWQAVGFPTVAVPGLRTSTGLPVGLQVIGRPGSEPTLLAVAAQVEQALRAAETLS